MQPPHELVWTDELLTRFWSYYARFPETYFSYQCGAAVVARVRHTIPAGAEVLDYGCGPGHLLPPLLQHGFRVSGADLSLETMRSAQDKAAGRAGFEGLFTIGDLAMRGRMFDAIFLLEVVEHLDDVALAATFDNVRRLLKPDGCLIATTPNEERLEDSMVYCPVANVTFHRWQHVRRWSKKTLGETLRQNGFGRTEIETCTFSARDDALVPPLRRAVHRIMTRLRKPQSLLAIART